MTDEQLIETIKRGNDHHKTLDTAMRSLQQKDFSTAVDNIDTLVLYLKILKYNIEGLK